VNLADFLPLSLESLTLAECPVTGLDLLVKMLEQKEVRLPKLSKIRIGMAGYEYMDMLKLAEAAETAGVNYSKNWLVRYGLYGRACRYTNRGVSITVKRYLLEDITKI